MHILLNGKRHEMLEDASLAALLDSLDLQNKRFAVEVNEELIPRSEHAEHALHNDDRVEIVQAIGGG
ncbi:MAG: sulfur carrier protein ThiS [Sedimenticolaceae bacterium]